MNFFKLVIAINLMLLTACFHTVKGGKGLAPLRTELGAAGFDLNYPVSDFEKPGYMYTIMESPYGVKFRKTICANAFTTKPLDRGTLVFADYEFQGSKNIGLGLGLADKVLKNVGEAKAKLSHESVKKIIVKFPTIKKYEVAEKFTDGEQRKINPDCELNIRELLNKDGNFALPTFLIIGTAELPSLQYEFEISGKSGASLGVAIKSIVDVSPSYSSTFDGKKTLTIEPKDGNAFVIGAQPIQIASAKILSRVAGEFRVEFTQLIDPTMSVKESLSIPLRE